MANNPEKSFEQSLQRLEEIVHILEADNPSLDEALKLFEEGKSLIEQCTDKLDKAEQKLKILTADGKIR